MFERERNGDTLAQICINLRLRINLLKKFFFTTKVNLPDAKTNHLKRIVMMHKVAVNVNYFWSLPFV